MLPESPYATTPYARPRDMRNPYLSHEYIVQSVAPGALVLDIGCAAGQIASSLRAKGCRVIGVELNAELACRASHHCEAVITGDITTPEVVRAAASKGPYDTIIVAEVLEHVVNPRDVIRALTPLLANRGHFVISVPNVAYWWVRLNIAAGRFIYKQSGILDENHLRFYTLTTARDLLKSAGLLPILAGVGPACFEGRKINRIPLFGHFLLLTSWRIAGWLARVRPTLFGYQFVFQAVPPRRTASH